VTNAEPIAPDQPVRTGRFDGKPRRWCFTSIQGHVMLPLDAHRVEARCFVLTAFHADRVAGVDLRPGYQAESARSRRA